MNGVRTVWQFLGTPGPNYMNLRKKESSNGGEKKTLFYDGKGNIVRRVESYGGQIWTFDLSNGNLNHLTVFDGEQKLTVQYDDKLKEWTVFDKKGRLLAGYDQYNRKVRERGANNSSVRYTFNGRSDVPSGSSFEELPTLGSPEIEEKISVTIEDIKKLSSARRK